jgi:hypothetical protein
VSRGFRDANDDVIMSRPASCAGFVDSWGTEVTNSENSENSKRGTTLESLATAHIKGGTKRMVDNAPTRENMIR